MYEESVDGSMKNITVDARMINASGIGTVIQNILANLIQQRPQWIFTVIGREEILNKYDFIKYSNVNLVYCYAPIYSLREQFELPIKIPKETDLVWIPHYNIPVLYFGKMIVTVHDVFHLAMPQFVNGILKRLYARIMFNMVSIKANKIIAVSHFTETELERYVHIDKNKVRVIYNGIDENWFRLAKGTNIRCNPYILYVGNVKPHKNLKVLLKAFSKLNTKEKYDLIIVGKKDGFITNDEEIKNYISSNVYFTGYVENNLLKQYYKQASLFVYPSLYEGFGLPPLEAMACGVPVIASNIPAVAEVVGDAALLFDPLDEVELKNNIEILLHDSALRNIIIQRGFQRCQTYNWNEVVSSFIETIEESFNS